MKELQCLAVVEQSIQLGWLLQELLTRMDGADDDFEMTGENFSTITFNIISHLHQLK